MVNACLDRLRRRQVRRADPLPDDLEDHGRTDGPRPATRRTRVVDPADVALDHERRAAVLAALDALPLDQRAALVLVDMEGYPVEEAAAILDCAPGTVKSRCSRGRARLLPLLRRAPAGARPPGTPVPLPYVARTGATADRPRTPDAERDQP